MRFASLGSGSRGNATLIEVGETRVLLDCGFSCAELEKRLACLQLVPHDLDAVLVSHEHADHISGVARLSRRFGIPVWMTAGTEAVHRGGALADWRCFSGHAPFEIGDVQVAPYPVPHDAREPCQFVFSDGAIRFGVLTDAGSVTAHMVRALSGVDALLQECNHDPRMLANGPYPRSLQERVGGAYGHLSNQQAAEMLEQIDTDRLQHLVAAHVSEKNNCVTLVRQALSSAMLRLPCELSVAQQDSCGAWYAIR